MTHPTSEKPKANPRALSGLLPFLKPYRAWLLGAALFLMLAASATLAFPWALRHVIDSSLATGSSEEKAAALRTNFLLLFGVAAALGVFSAVRFFFVSWIGERVTADLRNAVYRHVLQQSPQFFETTQTGEVLSRLTADTTLVQTVVGSSLSMGLRNLVMGTGALIMLIITNPRVMGMVGAVLALIVLPSLWFGRRVRKLSRASQDRVADTSAIAGEVLNAMPTVQSYTAETREAERFDAATENAFLTAVRRTKFRSALIAFVIIGTSAALLWGLFNGTQAVMAGKISAGHLGQTVMLIIILASAFAVLGEVYGDLQRAAGATERLMELLHAKSPVQSPNSKEIRGLPSTNIDSSATNNVAIEFADVSFNYPSRPQTKALDGFDLQVKSGETVALVGASGAGKTTVFQLLQRFYDVNSGTLRVLGDSATDLDLHALRARMAVVSQDSVMFSASVADNIRYGRPDATLDEVKKAAQDAFAHEFIEALPEGYDSFVGERGVRLSGGQKQRLAIARALLKAAPILLLDEATSALDAESERMVQAALDQAMRDRTRTTLVIAHRLATVQNADRIVVLDAGRVVESGTHAELINRQGAYAKLAALQFQANK
jgi:ATP-binding cassette, subfamily B, bacterial